MNDLKSEKVFQIYSEAKNRILLYVRTAVPSNESFEAVRKLILDELGRSGAEGKVKALLEKTERAGKK